MFGDGGAPPPPMRTPGSRARAIGLAILLVSVSAGINLGAAGSGFVLLLGFIGILAGVGLVIAGVRMADSAASIAPAVFEVSRALAALRRRHLPVVGFVVASSAVTLVSGEAGPLLCFALFTLFLLGLSMMNLRALDE